MKSKKSPLNGLKSFIKHPAILSLMYKKRYKLDVVRGISKSFNNKSSANLGKKGQITIFIIIGIVLLLSLILVLTLRKEIVTFTTDEIIPPERGKVEQFVTSCIDRVGEEALFRLGLQGGYVYMPDHIENDGWKHLRISPMNVVPFWAYGEVTNVPSLEDLQKEIDVYMEENLRACLFDLEPFQSTYDVVEKSRIESSTEIVDTKVIFNVDWALEVRDKAGELVTELVNHRSENPAKLKRLHQTAERVILREMAEFKFEDLTQDLISMEHPDVPLMGIEIACGKKEWDLPKVRTSLKDMLRINLRELRIKGTDFVEFPNELSYYQNHYVWDIGEDFSNPDVSALFSFENNYPFYMDVSPRSGNTLKSGQFGDKGDLLSKFCMQAWKFTYDVTYPVLVNLRDETTGYNFKFALTVHLKGNIPDRKEGFSVSKQSFLTTTEDKEYCRNANVPMTVYTYELVENPDTGVFNREVLPSVDLSYTCLRFSCEVGKTEYDFAGMGDVAAYRTNFPYCVGGILRGEKDNYKENWKRVVSEADQEVELDLIPIFEFPTNKIRVMKQEQLDDIRVGRSVEIRSDEMALIKITYTRPNETEIFHQSQTVYSGVLDEEVLAGQDLQFLGKADFNYHLEVSVLEDSNYIGGYRGNWTVSWNELQSAEEIVFHVISKKDGSEDERFELMLDLTEKSRMVPQAEINN